MGTYRILSENAAGEKVLHVVTASGRTNPHLKVIWDERVQGKLPEYMLPPSKPVPMTISPMWKKKLLGYLEIIGISMAVSLIMRHL